MPTRRALADIAELCGLFEMWDVAGGGTVRRLEVQVMDADPAAVGGTQRDPGETQYDLDEPTGSVSVRPAVGGVVAELAAAGFADAVEVGRGGFGVVYRCRQVGLGRSVAVRCSPWNWRITGPALSVNSRRWLN